MEAFLASGMHWKIFNFLAFLSLLVIFLRKPFSEFWKTRSHAIAFEMEEAKSARKEAGKRAYDLEMRFGRLGAETAELIRELREEGNREKEKILEHAQQSVGRMKRDATWIMEQEVLRTKELLKRQVVELSIEMAGRIIREKFSPADQETMATKFVERLEGGPC